MILLKLSICFIVLLAGIILTHESEFVPQKCPSESKIRKRSAEEDLPKVHRSKRDPSCSNLKFENQAAKNPPPQTSDTSNRIANLDDNVIQNSSGRARVNRKKRNLDRTRCDPKNPGPCAPPPPETSLPLQTP